MIMSGKIITSPQSVHNENAIYYFRAQYSVDDLCKSFLNIYADSRYKMYVNGELAAIGPCKQTSDVRYYDSVDISNLIKQGINTIDIHVLQLSSNAYSSKDAILESVIRSGDMVLSVWGNIAETKVETNSNWLVSKETDLEFFCPELFDFYNVSALSENIGANYRKNLNFENAVENGSVYNLETECGTNSLISVPVVSRKIPMVYFKQREFLSVKNNIYDAGMLTCGFIRLKCRGKGKIKLICAESMAFIENGTVKKRKRDDESGVVVGNYDLITVDGECFFEPFWMKTFRYIKLEISGNVEIAKFDYLETGYPLEVCSDYDFGNPKDNRLFEISVNSLKRCMHESYMDCPYYEQLQYTMDTHLQMLYTYQLTCDKALCEKAIDDFAKSYCVGGLTQSRFPSNKNQYIPGFALFFIMMLYEHSKRFGDRNFIRHYIHIADGILNWFYERLDGFMVPRSNLWDFVDWAEEYDFGQTPQREPGAVYSLMLAYGLEITHKMHLFLGNDEKFYIPLSQNIKNDVKKRCYCTQMKLYADTPSKLHFAQHSQIWAVLTGLETGENAVKLLENSEKLNCKATLAYMFFLFRAFEKAGIYKKSKEYLNSLKCLADMGCTTTPEWIGEDVRSECHAWGAVAIYEFTAKVLGVTYNESKIKIEPYINGRDYAKGSVATPKGMVYCSWKKQKEKFVIKIELPKNETASLVMPDGKTYDADSGEYACLI